MSSSIENYKTQKNMDKCGMHWFKFDEASGNIIDSKGSAVGTPSNITRTNGVSGNALVFNGSASVTFNSQVIPLGKKSVRFKLMINATTFDANEFIMSNGFYSNNGFSVDIGFNSLRVYITKGNSNIIYITYPLSKLSLNTWYDILFTFEGSVGKLYINDMVTPVGESKLTSPEVQYSYNLVLGKLPSVNISYSRIRLDELEVYNDVINPFSNKTLIISNGDYIYYNSTTSQWESLPPSISENDWLNQGNDVITKDMLQQLAVQNITGKIAIRKF